MDGFIFDMDGVLIDTERMFLECWIDVAEEFGLDREAVRQMAYDCIGLTMEETKRLCYERLGEDLPFEDILKRVREIYKKREIVEGVPAKPGVYIILEYLKTNRIIIGLASSTAYDSIVRKLEELKIIDYFKVIVGGDMVENGKPAPDVYLEACRRLGFTPSRTVAIEDSENGLKSARAAGMKTIMVPDLLPYREELKPYVDEKFNSLNDVLEAIRKGEFGLFKL